MTDIVPRPPSQLDELARLGQWLAYAENGGTDEISRGAAAALRLYYARELGLTPMAASELSLIKGRLVVGAALLRALAKRAGYAVKRTRDNKTTCTAVIADAATGEIIGDATFTIDDAKQAGLIRSGSAWTTHPARMLWARASTNVIRDYAPEVALGMVLDDEAREIAPSAQAGSDDSDLPWSTTHPTGPRGPDYRPPPEQQPLPVEQDIQNLRERGLLPDDEELEPDPDELDDPDDHPEF